jgi:proteasome lid subunit RPN8/RPN11
MRIPKQLKSKTIQDIMEHAREGYPNEICGVIVTTAKTEKYVRCINTAEDSQDEFVMCPESFSAAESLGDVVGIVHSHPDGSSVPSKNDIAVMSRNREIELIVDPESQAIPWHIVSYPEGDYRQIIPDVHESLLGRPFVHNVWDCWSTCENYYNRYHGLSFRGFDRKDRWWEIKDTTSFYEEYYDECGFVRVTDLKPNDLLIMQIGRTYHPNHAGIYLGDQVSEFEGKTFHKGQPLMLHHMYEKKSDVIVYGGQWHQRTTMILRHKDLE